MRANIIDSGCGTGKTEYAIRHLLKEEDRVIYLTPYLREVERIRESCPHMKEPIVSAETGKNKREAFMKLLNEGESIVMTHALFLTLEVEVAEKIREHGYRLVLDEVLNVLTPVSTRMMDIDTMFELGFLEDLDYGGVRCTEKGLAYLDFAWSDLYHTTDYKFFMELEAARAGRLLHIGESVFVWRFPADLLFSFSDVWILTYMFNQQTMSNYLRVHGVQLVFHYMEDYKLVEGYKKLEGKEYADLIDIVDSPKLNAIGKQKTALSSSWYNNNYDKLDILRRHMINFVKRYASAKSKDVMWTSFKKSQEAIADKGFINGFVSCTARATNEYRDRTACAYLINRYENPLVYNYFHNCGLTVNQDVFALSELIQWLFRSAIRDKKPIKLYIPSSRMRGFLQSWLDGTFEDIGPVEYAESGSSWQDFYAEDETPIG